MPDIKIVDRHCTLSRVSGRFREANRPALGHDQEGQDHDGDSCNGCRSHWVASISLDCGVCNLGWNESTLCEWAHTECRFFSMLIPGGSTNSAPSLHSEGSVGDTS